MQSNELQPGMLLKARGAVSEMRVRYLGPVDGVHMAEIVDPGLSGWGRGKKFGINPVHWRPE